MKQQINELKVNGIEYIPKDTKFTPIDKNEIEVAGERWIRKDSILKNAKLTNNLNGMPYRMVRTQSAGVFMGYIKSRKGKEVELLKARRIWYWTGAASLSQLSQEGTSKPQQCKFPCEVENVILTEVIEMCSITEKAKLILDSVPIWKQ
jgi:hypothetical protein